MPLITLNLWLWHVFVRKKPVLCSTKRKSMSLDWHEKVNYGNTSCPKLKWIFLSRFLYLKGPSVDHLMKWSRWAVWHREQVFVQTKNPIFPRQTIFQYLKYKFLGFFPWKILDYDKWAFSQEDICQKPLPEQFYKNTVQNQCFHYVQSMGTHSFNSVSVCSCLKGDFIKFIV